MLVLPLAINWLLAAVLTALNGRRTGVIGLGVAGLAASLGVSLWLAVQVFTGGPLEMVAGGWAPGIGITLRADALGIIFVVLANGLLMVALLYVGFERTRERALPAIILFLAAGLNGLFLTGDAFNFYVFFEVSMTASFVLASHGQGSREIRDTLTFTVVNLLGSIFFLTGVVSLYHVTGTLDLQAIAVWAETVEPASIILIATLIFVAFSVKLGLFPFHFWLPAVYRGVQPVMAAVLSGVLANIGSYGLLRFGAHVLRPELEFGAPVLFFLGGASVLYGAFQAVSRTTARETLAYSSISQAGYILLGLTIGGPAGYTAAVLFAVLNALNKTLLFLATGLRGWLVGVAFVVGAFSVAGVPPSAGFWGKAALFRAGLAADNAGLVALVFLGGALSFIYMFRIYQQNFWVEETAAASAASCRWLVLALAGLVLLLGVWPEPLLALSSHAAAALEGPVP